MVVPVVVGGGGTSLGVWVGGGGVSPVFVVVGRRRSHRYRPIEAAAAVTVSAMMLFLERRERGIVGE